MIAKRGVSQQQLQEIKLVKTKIQEIKVDAIPNDHSDITKQFMDSFSGQTAQQQKRDLKAQDKEAEEEAEMKKKCESRQMIKFTNSGHYDCLADKRAFQEKLYKGVIKLDSKLKRVECRTEHIPRVVIRSYDGVAP